MQQVWRTLWSCRPGTPPLPLPAAVPVSLGCWVPPTRQAHGLPLFGDWFISLRPMSSRFLRASPAAAPLPLRGREPTVVRTEGAWRAPHLWGTRSLRLGAAWTALLWACSGARGPGKQLCETPLLILPGKSRSGAGVVRSSLVHYVRNPPTCFRGDCSLFRSHRSM